MKFPSLNVIKCSQLQLFEGEKFITLSDNFDIKSSTIEPLSSFSDTIIAMNCFFCGLNKKVFFSQGLLETNM